MKSVLIVDDSIAVARQLEKIINNDDEFEVVGQGRNGAEAIKLCQQLKPEIVCMDMNMPVMDGISLISELRALPGYKFTPLLMLTTESSSAKKRQGKAAGATGWIVKPFNPEQLINTVKKVLG